MGTKWCLEGEKEKIQTHGEKKKSELLGQIIEQIYNMAYFYPYQVIDQDDDWWHAVYTCSEE